MKLPLTERQRFVIYLCLNSAQCGSRVEQRGLDRSWTALELDAISAKCEAATAPPRLLDFSDEPREFEIASNVRDALISLLEPTPQRPATGGASRVLFPIVSELLRSRDGEEAAK